MGLSPTPVFSVPSGVFSNDTVTFTMSASSGTIRFTLDGSVPTGTSPIYTGSITVSTNVVVKAQLFEAGLPVGPVVSRTYHFLDASARAFDSNLPILILNTSGRTIPDNVAPGQLRAPGSLVVIDTVRGRSSLLGEPEFIGLAEFEIFGQTAAGFPKKPYTIEIQDELRNDQRVPLLGMPAEADWKLRNPYNDKTFLNDFLACELFEQMGRNSVRRRFVEVFVDTSGGRIRYPQDYVGVMVLLERIERGADRVAIAELKPSDNALPEISGGYMWKKDKDSAGDLNFATAGGNGFFPQVLKIHEPKPREITAAQLDWLRNHLNQFERALYAANWLTASGTNHYSSYIDVDSFVDQHWIVEFTKNIDGYRLSNYMQKDRAGKIKMEPIWGWDRSFGNADYLEGGLTNGWYWNLLGNADHLWLRRLLYGNPNVSPASPVIGTGDPDFIQKIIDRWGVLRTNVLAPSRLLARVDELSSLLSEAAMRDFSKYPRLGTYLWPNPGGAPNWHVDYVRPTNYAGIITEMKKWIQGRCAWLDGQFVQAPFFNHPGGLTPAGFYLTINAPAGSIYYTLDGSDPRAPGGSVAPGARTYAGPIAIATNARVFARARARDDAYGWSPRSELTLFVSVPALRITEIMFHPAPSAAENGSPAEQFEYLELRNVGATPLDVTGCRLSGAVDFTFPNLTLQAGQRVLAVKNRAAFESRYGGGLLIAGEFSGALDDAGERIVLQGPRQEPILDFSYDGDWYPVTDGHGFSLVIVDDTAPPQSWGAATSWRPSGMLNGSPGQPDPAPPDFPQVVINEVLPHIGSALTDAVELRNLSSAEADVSGWFLTDDLKQPRKFRIPDDTHLPAGEFLVFTGNSFNTVPGTPTSFSLSGLGDAAYLFSGDAATNLTGYLHGFAFGAQHDGVTFGRYVTSVGEEHFVSESGATLGGPNLGALIGPVVISEVMYHPPDVPANGAFWDNVEDEFIELFNRSSSPVNLFDPGHPENTWRLREAVEFEFPPDITLNPDRFLLVVGFDPAAQPERLSAFRERYNLSDATRIVGPYRGHLSNQGSTIALFMPDAPVTDGPDAGTVPYVLVEQVHYSARPPWSAAADGAGFSLHRRDPAQYADDPINWEASAPTAAGPYVPGPPPTITSQPQNQTAITFNSASFNVAVGGPGPHRFQWRHNGTNLPSATNTVLVIDAVQLTDAGHYQVLVMNNASSVESAIATLTVLVGVFIEQQPLDQTVRAGTNVHFTVVASSASAIHYQWRFNGTNLPGATNATLAIQIVTNVHEGVYSVVCTDEVGSISSRSAQLRVLLPPLLVSPAPPLRLTAVVGETVTLGVHLQGSAPLFCRWRLFRPNGTGQILSDQFLATPVSYLTLTVTPENVGAYAVVLTNNVGGAINVALTNAILTVLADTDGDLMPDDFEMAHGLLPNDPRDGMLSADADGDGLSNRQEYLAGTDPQNSASFLKIDSVAVAEMVSLRFGAVSNRTYTIQYADSLNPGARAWQKLADIDARSTNRVETVFDPGLIGKRYYRVVTPRQP